MKTFRVTWTANFAQDITLSDEECGTPEEIRERLGEDIDIPEGASRYVEDTFEIESIHETDENGNEIWGEVGEIEIGA